MSNNVVVISPKCTVLSAKYLAKQLGADYVNPYKAGRNDFGDYDLVINYGITGDIIGKRFINSPASVRNAVDKIRTFTLLQGKCNIVPWSTKKTDAIAWIKDNHYVAARLTKSGYQGKGLIITDDVNKIMEHSYELFTRYIHHDMEIRVNVFKGKIVSIVEKHDDGGEDFRMVLVRDKGKYNVEKIIKAINSNLDLDMYGADILVDNRGRCHLLEVNSSPSLHGYTSLQFVYALLKEIN
jgi:glutathione synthase/RimK-type ligase-like ATP-grasp enzyme